MSIKITFFFLSIFLQLEQWFEQALKENKGFIIKKMGEDGACLFRAVGKFWFLLGTQI